MRILLLACLAAPLSWAGESPNPWACAAEKRVPVDPQVQIKVLDECARQGNASAMFVLANRLRDKQAARELLLRAAELEHAESLYQLGLEEKDPQKAAQYMKLAAHALQHR
ncbi:MAG: hypothetical protein K0R58_2279 [Ramlibacter sp.]|jgi:TPR repeat protein|nr:hypothetical protein [Ramlibacter sp.]